DLVELAAVLEPALLEDAAGRDVNAADEVVINEDPGEVAQDPHGPERQVLEQVLLDAVEAQRLDGRLAVGRWRAQVLELLEESLPPGWFTGRRELEDRQHEEPVELGIQWLTVAVPDPVDGPQRRGQEHRDVQCLGDNTA